MPRKESHIPSFWEDSQNELVGGQLEVAEANREREIKDAWGPEWEV